MTLLSSPIRKPIRANSGIVFRPDADTVLWTPGQDDAFSSTLRDRSGNNKDGDLTGASWTKTANGLTVNSFDGDNDVIDFGDDDSFSFGNGTNDSPFSLLMWINETDTLATRHIMSKWNSTGGQAKEWLLQVASTGRLEFHVFDLSEVIIVFRRTDVLIGTGKDLLVGVTYDGRGGADAMDGVTLYVNGGVMASTATNNAGYVAMQPGALTVRYGLDNGSLGDWLGTLGLGRIISRELTSGQMGSIFRNERGLVPV